MTTTILIVDDHPLFRKGLHLIFEEEQDMRVVGEAGDGQEAIEKYSQAMKNGEPYTMVIMDLTVPGGMGGGEAIKKLLDIDPQAKVIVSSGYSNNPIMANFNKFGFKGVMSKPFRLDEVKKTLELVSRS